MDIWDVEGNAAGIFELAKCDPSDPVGPASLIRRILGRDGLEFIDRSKMRTSVAKLCKVNGAFRVYAANGTDDADLAFNLSHELAEWLYWNEADNEKERACDALAAALVAPRPAFLRMLRVVGEDFGSLAHAFGSTPTSMAMRLGETTQRPVVVITRTHHFIRGREWRWQPEAELRRIAKAGGCPGIKSASLERKRTALLPDDVDAA